MSAVRNPAELLVLGANPNKKSLGTYRFLGRHFKARTVQEARRRAFRFMRAEEKRGRKINPASLVILGGNPRKRNAAEDVYRGFQGREPREVLEYDETQRMPHKAAVLGDLVALGFDNHTKSGDELHGDQLAMRWNECSHISFAGDDVKLASNSARTQLYLVGGDQELNEVALAKFGGSKLGPVYFIVYDTRKAQDNFEGGQYTHEFGEEGGRRPSAFYDASAQRILLRGGSYRIEDRGIVN